jgi:hypothetical protein
MGISRMRDESAKEQEQSWMKQEREQRTGTVAVN